MRVAVDTSPLISGHKIRGIGAHTRELISALKKAKTKKLMIDFVDFTQKDLSVYDLLHYQYFHPFFSTLPETTGAKIVVTIHDLMQLVYPKNYPPGIKGYIQFIRQKKKLKNIDRILTISETSKKDIIRFLKVNPETVDVVYLAAREIFKKLPIRSKFLSEVKKKYRLPNKFILYVGDVNFNKNIPNLIKASIKLGLHLVIVGKQALEIETQGIDFTKNEGVRDWLRFLVGRPHPELAHYKELLSVFKSNPKVIRLGFISDEELIAVYNLATVYCQPSYYEGFGLPVLEAMSCGCPVVITETNSLVEIAGTSALKAPGAGAEEIAEGIGKVIHSSKVRDRLISNGYVRSKKYSWKKTAESTLEVYKSVLRS